LQEAAVDLIDQLQVPGQQRTKQRQAPFLQGFGQQGVVGVGKRFGGDAPGRIPIQVCEQMKKISSVNDIEFRSGLVNFSLEIC
jgi:hypothetical protein